MPMPLEKWQERLERHFAALAAARSDSGFPLFALEHDLNNDEFAEIAGLLHSRLAAGSRLGTHWLVWVVYATELGYDYDGDEYWHSFEERTPYWRENTNHNRSHLRTWFSKFHATYHGVKPSGLWADWFSIIAWPITHAILPKYLQLQLAKALHSLRYRLAGLEALSAAAVGQLLAASAWDVSSRFRVFLEQEELAGRIVLALLSDRTVDGQSPIYAPTLQRIVSDLEQVRSAREWLKEAQRVVADRFKGTGLGSGPSSALREIGHDGWKNNAAVSPNIRPTLLLRCSGRAKWSVVVEVPSFGGIARLNPELRAFLKSTRCNVAGAAETWLPAGWLLSGAQRRVLKSWPDISQPLVRFERPNGTLDHLLDSECRMTPGPIWLCRIGADGIAREVVGRIVRPQREYILLGHGQLPKDHPLFTSCTVDCTGINAGLLSIPGTLSSEDVSWLHGLGIQVARTIRIWPAGLSGRGWDGEGHSEWLTTEALCFGIVHDHPIDAYVFRLNNGSETVIEAGRAGYPVFVRIPPLPFGRHSLSVRAQRNPSSPVTPSLMAEGVVTLEVREPEPWVPGTTSHVGLAISLDPHDPSLDTFWEGNVGVSILGPEGRHVTCSVALASANGAELLSEQIGTFDLPVTVAAWSTRFGQFVKDEERAWKYLEAASGRFIIRGDELGEYIVRLERDVKPVRWVCRSVHRTTTVRLIDDTGRDEIAVAQFFSFHQPAIPIPLDTKTILAGLKVEAPGGLFVAQHGEHCDALVASTPRTGDRLRGLVVEPDLQDLQGSSVAINSVFRLLEQWSDARLTGPLAAIQRDRITRGVLIGLYTKLCGSQWGKAETAFLDNPQSNYALKQLERKVDRMPGFAAVLRRDHVKMEAGTVQGTQWYTALTAKFKVCSDRKLCEFALRLASQPHRLSSFYGEELEQLLRQISDKVVLLRGARFLALLSAASSTSKTGGVTPRWVW